MKMRSKNSYKRKGFQGLNRTSWTKRHRRNYEFQWIFYNNSYEHNLKWPLKNCE